MSLLIALFFVASIFSLTTTFLSVVGLAVLNLKPIKDQAPSGKFSLSLICGAILIAIIVCLLVLFRIPQSGMRGYLLLLFLITLVHQRRNFIVLIKQNIKIIGLWFLIVTFYFLSILNSNLDIGIFMLSDIQAQFGLPIDNLIQFQTVRYITENISPNLLDPVPNWKFGDRGPLFGLVSSAVFLLLDVKEKLPWLSSSYPSSVVFEIIGIILNSLYFVPLFSLVSRISNEKSAYWSILLLSINPFLYINTVYTWPKLFSASFGIVALDFLLDKKLYEKRFQILFSSIVLAFGFLVHESIVFVLLAFLILLLRYFGFRATVYFFLIFALIQIPWHLFKILNHQSNLNLLLYNAFCIPNNESIGVNAIERIIRSLGGRPIVEFFKDKLGNIIYPMDFTSLNWVEIFSSKSLNRFIVASTDIVFYQFVFAFGLVPLIYLIYKSIFETRIRFPLILFISSLLSVGIFQGCPLSTWNHIWAYLPMIGLTVCFGLLIKSERPIFKIVFTGMHIYITASYLVSYIWFPPRYGIRFESGSIRELSLYGIILILIIYYSFLIGSSKKAESVD